MGICANGTVFSWINGTMLHPLPGVQRTADMVSIMRGKWNVSPTPPMSYPDYRDLRDRNQSFAGMLAFHHEWAALTGAGIPERIYVANTSANFFSVLEVKPHLGRFFLPEEEARTGGTPYVVISYALWQTHFAADPAIVGKSVEISQKPLTIVGVASEGFTGAMPGIRQDAWTPLDPGFNRWNMEHRGVNWLNVIGRLRPGISRGIATQDLETLMKQLVAAYPAEHPGINKITLDPLWRSPFGANAYMAASLPILFAIASVVLLMTCANVATLALVRLISRRREVAIRQSLGASRLQMMRQMILEGVLISLGGAMLAILFTSLTAKTLGDFLPPNSNPISINGSLDWSVVGSMLLFAVLATTICGALPAWRTSNVAAAEVLKEETPNAAAGGHNRVLLSGLVVAQVSLSLALLVSAGLFVRTLRNMNGADPGFKQDHVLTASVGLAVAGYPRSEIRSFHQKLFDRVAALPGVTNVALTDWVPFEFTRKTVDTWPEGYVPQLHESLEVRRADVTGGYFASLGIPVVEGRDFNRDDNDKAPRVVIVDQTTANRYWPGHEALGRRLNIQGNWHTVVGVVRNSKHGRINEPVEPMIYLSFFQNGDDETIVQIRTARDLGTMASMVEQTIHEIDSRVPVFDVRPMQETTKISNVFATIQSTFASIFALLALILAATGIYGVVAYRTQLRTHEIGVRVALGAGRGDVLKLVLSQGLRLIVSGLVLGVGLSLGLARLFAGLLYGVTAGDPITVISVVALLGAIAVLACYLPALRAMRINPVNAIRGQ
jgi:predicted permease